MSKIKVVAIFSWLSSFTYYLLEWTFFVTKTSPLSLVSFGDQLSVLAMSPLLLFLAVFITSLLLLALSFIPSLQKLQSFSVLGLPCLVLSCAVFLLIENFTYTVFGFNAGGFTSWTRYVYLIGLIPMTLVIYRQLRDILVHEYFARAEKGLFYLSATMFGLTVAVGLAQPSGKAIEELELTTRKALLPNILIFSTDGLRTSNMSAYGYRKKTTPFIESLLTESLVFENHYANNAKTTGSVLSMLSGKYPTTTRVVFRPDVFKGKHAYLHLPAVLRQLGYYNGDISVRHYVDAYDVNMHDGFDLANKRRVPRGGPLVLPKEYQEQFGLTALFIKETYQRIADRLLHITGIRDYSNPFTEVTALKNASRGTDDQRLEDLKAFINDSPRPFFASVHMLNTHGPKFYFGKAHFSKNSKPQGNWERAYYDDAILNYDAYVEEVVTLLKSEKIWENTIFIISSDHGMAWRTYESIPLIIRFPRAAHIGRITKNSQRIDIAPTLLDFLGVNVPDWMEGVSLIGPARDSIRNIYVGNRAPSREINGWREVPNPKPPFYTLGSLTLIHCQQSFRLDLKKNEIVQRFIKTHRAPCSGKDLISSEEARSLMIKHLEDRDYDISSLRHRRQ